MIKPKITVSCFFTDEGEAAAQIILRSFEFFLKQELAGDGNKFALSEPVHI